MAYDFVIGVDVGKYFHHACVLDPQGRQVLSKRINQHEGSLRKLFGQFLADNASVLVIVDQPNNISRLTVAVAQDMGGRRSLSTRACDATALSHPRRQLKDRCTRRLRHRPCRS